MRKIAIIALLSLITSLFPASFVKPSLAAGTQTYVLQQGAGISNVAATYVGAIDTTIDSTSPDSPLLKKMTPYNTLNTLFAENGESEKQGSKITLIKFDLKDIIPVGSQISSAELQLFGSGLDGTISIHGAGQSWDENATWNKINQTLFGAPMSAITFLSSENASQASWQIFDVTSEIKKIIENQQTNYGFALAQENQSPYFYSAYSSDDTTMSGGRPKLSITFSTVVPEEVIDTDKDGFADSLDNCPLVVNKKQVDNDKDGIGDACDNCAKIFNPDQTDNDKDKVGNICDNCINNSNPGQVDDDKDQLGNSCDICPKDATNNCLLTDADADGIDDSFDNCPFFINKAQVDNDGDGVGDACDNCAKLSNTDQSDIDGDKIGDVCDNCINKSNAGQVDDDNDKIGNICDACPNDAANLCNIIKDADSDGVEDSKDNCPLVANSWQGDVDFDKIGDACDECVYDATNLCNTKKDVDGDGIEDAQDNCPNVANVTQSDADFDRIGDACDACIYDVTNLCNAPKDSDLDGVVEADDNCPLVANTAQVDTDVDKIGDACDNCLAVSNLDQADSDADKIGNVCDVCPVDATNLCNTPKDADSDGVEDAKDNCINIANADQKDSDSDFVGDACDNCTNQVNSDQENNDSDTFGNVCDICPSDPQNICKLIVDSDYDGIADNQDNCKWDANYDQKDDDEDKIGNVCDFCLGDPQNSCVTDSDGDGRIDRGDNCPFVANSNQYDMDQDGRGDLCDNCDYSKNTDQTNNDGDSKGNACDVCENDNTDTCIEVNPIYNTIDENYPNASSLWMTRISQTITYPDNNCQSGSGYLRTPISVSETRGVDRELSPVRTGVPVPAEAKIYYPNQLMVADVVGGKDVEVPAQFRVLSRWDGEAADTSKPIKWVLVDFQLSLGANATENLVLRGRNCDFDQGNLIESETSSDFIVNTGAGKFYISKNKFNLFEQVILGNYSFIKQSNDNGVLIKRVNGTTYLSDSDVSVAAMVEETGPLHTVIRLTGKHNSNTDPNLDMSNNQIYQYCYDCGISAHGKPERKTFNYLNYTVRVHFYKDKSYVRVVYTIENPDRQIVNRLGTGGERTAHTFVDYRTRLNLNFSDSLNYYFGAEAATQAEYKDKNQDPEHGTQLVSGSLVNINQAKLYQDSSGVAKWAGNCVYDNHPETCVDSGWGTTFRGYKVYEDNNVKDAGLQSLGWGSLVEGSRGVAVGMRQFWQNFPKAVYLGKNGTVDLGIFPEEFSLDHRFDGGKNKTNEILYYFYDDNSTADKINNIFEDFNYPLMALAEPEYYQDSLALGLISTKGSGDDYYILEAAAEHSIGIDMPVGWEKTSVYDGMFAADEYGWLSYGDHYRDGSKGSRSWGNSEFDLSYDFLLQYLRRDEHNYEFYNIGEIAAKHLADIDIYHTDEDESSYSHGVRMHDYSGARDHWQQPGPSHFWLEGLLTYYSLTGDEHAREAAEEAAFWVKSMFDPKVQELIYNGETRNQAWSSLALMDLYSYTGKQSYLDLSKRILYGEIIDEQNLPGAQYPYSALDWHGEKNRVDKTDVTPWNNGYVDEALGQYAWMKRLQGQKDVVVEDALAKNLDALWKYGYAREDNGLFDPTREDRDQYNGGGQKLKSYVVETIQSDGAGGVANYYLANWPNNQVLTNGFAYASYLADDPAIKQDYLNKAKDTWIWVMGPYSCPAENGDRAYTNGEPIYADGSRNSAKNMGYLLRFGQVYLNLLQQGQ